MTDYDPFVDNLLHACKWALIGILVGAGGIGLIMIVSYFIAHRAQAFS